MTPDLSVQKMASWLETKDPNERYSYSCNGRCLCAQFLASQGLDAAVTPDCYILQDDIFGDRVFPLPRALDDIAFGDGGDEHRFTFGAALTRARRSLTIENLLKAETSVREDA